jgi:hypothetical protein
MNPLSLITGGITGILEAGNGVVKTIFGDKSARESSEHDENMATKAQFTSEFMVQNRTKFDSLVDGLNRLPRPTIVAMVVYYFWLSQHDTIEFQRLNLALSSIPENMWILTGVVTSFYFVVRELHKNRDRKMALSQSEFNERMRQDTELNDAKIRRDGHLPDREYRQELADESTPMSNPAIEEWNRRRKAGGK